MDEIKNRKLLILSAGTPAVNAFTHQLRLLGLECASVASADQVAKYLTDQLPDFVLMPYDYSNYNQIVSLAALFQKHYASEVVGYVEKDSAAMVNRLTQSGLKYTLLPPLAAKAAAQLFRKILKENPLKFSRLDEARGGKKSSAAETGAAKAEAAKPSSLAAANAKVVAAIKDDSADENSEGLLDRSVQAALDQLCKNAGVAAVKSLKKVRRLNFLPVFDQEKEEYRGLLVTANATNAANENFNAQFNLDLGDLLKNQLQKGGFNVTLGKWSSMGTDEVEFVPWAVSDGQLLKIGFHGGEEIGVSFFPMLELNTKLKPAAEGGQFLVPISYFDKNVLINYDVAVPTTDEKTGLAGQPISAEQLDALKRKGLTELMVGESVLANYFQYISEVHLKKLIERFEFVLLNRELKSEKSVQENQERMQVELTTAASLQTFIFPKEHFLNADVEIRGISHRASEVGGDWWYYSQVGTKLFLWIGDATGHGVSAALVTSAAKSVSSILKDFPELPLPKVMAMMNTAIHAAGGGKVQMTFVLASIELKTGEVKCSNASHQNPFVFANREPNYTKKNLIIIDCNPGHRLGESPEATYTEYATEIEPGDRLFFYTDGIIELENESGEQLGERKFIQSLLKVMSENQGVTTPFQAFNRHIELFRKSKPFVDDATYFMVQYKPQARRMK